MFFPPDRRPGNLGQELIRGRNNHQINARMPKGRFPVLGGHGPPIPGGEGLSPSQLHVRAGDEAGGSQSLGALLPDQPAADNRHSQIRHKILNTKEQRNLTAKTRRTLRKNAFNKK
jgi:hypothetical protein